MNDSKISYVNLAEKAVSDLRYARKLFQSGVREENEKERERFCLEKGKKLKQKLSPLKYDEYVEKVEKDIFIKAKRNLLQKRKRKELFNLVRARSINKENHDALYNKTLDLEIKDQVEQEIRKDNSYFHTEDSISIKVFSPEKKDQLSIEQFLSEKINKINNEKSLEMTEMKHLRKIKENQNKYFTLENIVEGDSVFFEGKDKEAKRNKVYKIKVGDLGDRIRSERTSRRESKSIKNLMNNSLGDVVIRNDLYRKIMDLSKKFRSCNFK